MATCFVTLLPLFHIIILIMEINYIGGKFMKKEVPKYGPIPEPTPDIIEMPEVPENDSSIEMPPPPTGMMPPSMCEQPTVYEQFSPMPQQQPMYPPMYQQQPMMQPQNINMICCPMLTNAECPMLYQYGMKKPKHNSPCLSDNPPCYR